MDDLKQREFESCLLVLQRERDRWALSAPNGNGGRTKDVDLAVTSWLLDVLGVDRRIVRAIEEGTLRVVDPHRPDGVRGLIARLLPRR